MSEPLVQDNPDDNPAFSSPWARYLSSELDRLSQNGQLRSVEPVEPLSAAHGPIVRVAGREQVLFCSNDYLGLANDRRVIEAAKNAAHEGVGSRGARLLCGSHRLHRALEERLAAWKGCEDGVLFGSGYLANIGTLSSLLKRGDTVFSDRLNHASIVDGCRLSGAQVVVFPHRDMDALAKQLQTGTGKKLIVSDTVFSMDGDVAPLQTLSTLAQTHEALLMVDEAHATGVLGAGATEFLGQKGRVPVVMGTCSKALGTLGGFVVGSRLLCDFLRQRARTFVFDTSLPPPIVAATLAALDVIEQEPERAERTRLLAQRLFEGLSSLGFAALRPSAAIVPVLFGDTHTAMSAQAALRQAGILAFAIRPPTVPQGTARIRLCTMATHTDGHIDRVLDAFASFPSEWRRPDPGDVKAQPSV